MIELESDFQKDIRFVLQRWGMKRISKNKVEWMNLQKVLVAITNHEKTISKRDENELKRSLWFFSSSNIYESNHNSSDC